MSDEADWIRARLAEKPDITGRELPAELHECKVDAKRLIFIDETWAKTNMTRTHGRCAVGQQLVAKVPHGH